MRIRKLANALIPNATPSELVTGAALTAVEGYGGLWVGGTIDISDGAVSFTPNGLNMAFHVGLEIVRIPLVDICSVRREFGWLTGIVVLKHPGRVPFSLFRGQEHCSTSLPMHEEAAADRDGGAARIARARDRSHA